MRLCFSLSILITTLIFVGCTPQKTSTEPKSKSPSVETNIPSPSPELPSSIPPSTFPLQKTLKPLGIKVNYPEKYSLKETGSAADYTVTLGIDEKSDKITNPTIHTGPPSLKTGARISLSIDERYPNLVDFATRHASQNPTQAKLYELKPDMVRGHAGYFELSHNPSFNKYPHLYDTKTGVLYIWIDLGFANTTTENNRYLTDYEAIVHSLEFLD